MARFGLSDSESDSSANDDRQRRASSSASSQETSASQLSPSSSAAAQRKRRPLTRSQRQQQTQTSTAKKQKRRANAEADAPPRASLAYSDDDTMMQQDSELDQDESEHSGMDADSQLDEDEVEDEDDEGSLNSDDEDEQEHSSSSSSTTTYSSPSQTSAAQTAANGAQGPRPPPTWAPNSLNIEPKRVAVMQASFFQQQQSPVHVKAEAAVTSRNPFQNTSNLLEHAGSPFAARPPPPAQAAAAPVSAPPIDPRPFRQLREYERVPLSLSITHNKHGNLVDTNLAFGRSFRPSWGPNGEIVHLGSLYKLQAAKSDTLTVEQLKTTQTFDARAAEQLLRLQLEHTSIELDETLAPVATPNDDLRFHHYASALPTTDRTTEAHLWRLGHALFDEIADLELPPSAAIGGGQDSSTTRYIESIRRRDRLESWLADVVRTEVEDDLRSISGGGGTSSDRSAASTGAKRIFALLTGHQIERACEAAVEAGDLRLATLVAQAGGDDDFREDVYLQLAKWREYRVDAHVDSDLRRVYEVLCGNVGLSEGRNKGDIVDDAAEFHVAEGLGWKRAFGLHLWYGTFQSSVATAVERYEAASSKDANRVAQPKPDYLSRASPSMNDDDTETRWRNLDKDSTPTDPLFQLIKLFTSTTHALEQVLMPRNFSSSPLDYRLPWHLYILFSRVLRKRDFEDRVIVDGQDSDDGMQGDVEGNSVRADMVTEAYATQLELAGLWQWSVFVLLHLELPARREAAIRQLLTRRAAELDDDAKFTFLVDTLHVPATWIYSCQSTYEHYNDNVFAEYKLLVMAQEWSKAHEIAVVELVPEAIVRGDLKLVKRLLEPFNSRRVADWQSGAQTYLDYVTCLEQQISLQKGSINLTNTSSSSLVTKTIDKVQTLASSTRAKQNFKFKVALTEMLSRLTVVSKSFDEYLTRIQPSILQDSDRLVWVQGMSSSFLDKALQKALAS
ncbi:hypothetical protein ACM66B_006603 [Microbotryomycetes sp. NB124-2]